MQQYRKNEEPKSRFRSERFFTINNDWYFTTREDVQVGPFRSMESAKQALVVYLNTMDRSDYSARYAKSIAQNGTWRSTNYQ